MKRAKLSEFFWRAALFFGVLAAALWCGALFAVASRDLGPILVQMLEPAFWSFLGDWDFWRNAIIPFFMLLSVACFSAAHHFAGKDRP